MIRRQFLKQSSLVGAVLAAGPVQGLLGLIQAKPRVVQLPAAETHVRHGGWKAPQRFALAGMPQLQSIQRNVYFADGCAASGKDLKQLRLEWNREWVQCCVAEQTVFLGDAYHSRAFEPGQKWESLKLANGLHLTVGSLEHDLHLLSVNQRTAMLPLDGSITWDGSVLELEEMLVIPAGHPVNLSGFGKVLLLSDGPLQS